MARGAAWTCSSCGTLNKPTWEFCARCGEQLESAAPRPAAAAASVETVVDDEPTFPWRQAFTLVLVVGVIAGALSLRNAGPPPSAGALLTIPTVPPAPGEGAPAVSVAPERARLMEGNRLLASGDVQGALAQLAVAADDLPQDPGAQQAYARALWTAGEKDAALSRFRMAAQLAPQDVGYPLDFARALIDSGQKGEAQEVLEQALGTNPGDPRVLQDLGQLYTNGGAADKAVPLLRRAVELRGEDDPKLLAQLGVALEKTGQRQEAISVLETTVSQVPTSATARTLLADALYKEGRKDDAMQIVQAGLERSPDASMLHRTMGLLLERSGRAADAAQAYRDYIRLTPNAPDAPELAARAAALERRSAPPSSS